MKNRSHRLDRPHRPRPRHGHRSTTYKMYFSV